MTPEDKSAFEAHIRHMVETGEISLPVRLVGGQKIYDAEGRLVGLVFSTSLAEQLVALINGLDNSN